MKEKNAERLDTVRERKRESYNLEKGITLIVLIITIILLLIIAGVTVDIAIDGKLFDNAKQASDRTNDRVSQGQGIIDAIKDEWERLEGTGGETGEIQDTTPPEGEIIINKITEESIEITVNARDLESGLAETETFAYYINSESTARYTGTNNTYTYTNLTSGTEHTIRVKIKDQAGNECEITKPVTTEKEIVTATVIAQNPTVYYGKEVVNYGVIYDNTAEATNKWRIFYADESNIYLIADDYIHKDYAPKAGSYEIDANTNYRLDMVNVYKNYTGATNIDSTLGNKWLSKYYPSYKSSANTNIRAVAYMLDTSIWNPIYKNEYAEYAIGGPTLEMFCESYKDTHQTNYIECTANSTGYQVRWQGGTYGYSISGLRLDEYNSIYIKSDYSKSDGMWLASPSASDPNYLLRANYYRLCEQPRL